MGSFSIWHWLLVLLIIVLVFGTSKLKNLGKDLGESIRNFKQSLNDEKKDINNSNTNQNDQNN